MRENIDMKKLNFVKDGVTKLPPGFRFQPTEDELVFQYLKCKVFSRPLPASIIPEINVFKYDPWDLPGDSEGEKYFFCNLDAKYPNGNRTNRATGSGHWKTTGSDKQIISPRRTPIMGMKKTLVFHRGEPQNGTKTDWVMHEYRLVCKGTSTCNLSLTENLSPWVLCHMFLRKKNSTNGYAVVTGTCHERDFGMIARPKFFDYTKKDDICLNLISFTSSPSSSSSSSVITEVSSSGSDNEENIDSYTSASTES